MSTKTHQGGEHHEAAADHHESAAHHHREAAKHYDAGDMKRPGITPTSRMHMDCMQHITGTKPQSTTPRTISKTAPTANAQRHYLAPLWGHYVCS
jgi:hypothetical protein